MEPDTLLTRWRTYLAATNPLNPLAIKTVDIGKWYFSLIDHQVWQPLINEAIASDDVEAVRPLINARNPEDIDFVAQAIIDHKALKILTHLATHGSEVIEYIPRTAVRSGDTAMLGELIRLIPAMPLELISSLYDASRPHTVDVDDNVLDQLVGVKPLVREALVDDTIETLEVNELVEALTALSLRAPGWHKFEGPAAAMAIMYKDYWAKLEARHEAIDWSDFVDRDESRNDLDDETTDMSEEENDEDDYELEEEALVEDDDLIAADAEGDYELPE
jgi:hypothetical protein